MKKILYMFLVSILLLTSFHMPALADSEDDTITTAIEAAAGKTMANDLLMYPSYNTENASISAITSIDNSLVFDLELSNYDASTGNGLANAVQGNNTTFTVNGTSKPALGTITTPFNTTTRYLTFKTYDGTTKLNSDRYVRFADDAFLNQDELTISLWVNKTQTDTSWDTLINFTNGTAGVGSSMKICPYNAAYYVYYPFSTAMDSASISNAASTAGKWRHILYTRKYDETTQKWDCAIYSDGIQTNFCKYIKASEAKHAEDDFYMQLGNFGGNISDVKIYTKYMESNDVTAYYNNTANNFVKGVDNIALESISPEAGNISINSGEITLTFNNLVDKETLSNISFVKANGEAVRGKVIVYLPTTYSKTVKVKYGNLEADEEYKLFVLSGVGSLNGCYTTQDYEYSFHTISNILLYEDFEGDKFVAEEQCPAIDGLTAVSSSVLGDWQDFMVHKDSATGRKYIDFILHKTYDASNVQQAAATNLQYSLPYKMTDEVIAFEIGFRASIRGQSGAGGTAGSRQILRPYSERDITGTSREITYTNSSGGCDFYGKNDETNSDGSKATFTTVIGDEGWYVLKLVTGIRKSDGKRYYDYYYDATDPTAFCRVTDVNYNPVTIGSVRFATSYLSATANDYNKIGVSIDYCKVYRVAYPSVSSSDVEEMDITKDNIGIYFDSDINEDSLENSEIYFENTAGERVRATYGTYDENDRAAYVNLHNYFLYDSTYTLYVKGVQSTDGYSVDKSGSLTFKTPNYEVQQSGITLKNHADGSIVTTLNQAAEIDATIALTNIANTSKFAYIFFQHYDVSGRLKSTVKTDINIPANDISITTSAISGATFEEGDYVKVYSWDVMGDLRKAISFEPTQINYSAKQ